jgi:hypothetical protein
VIDRRALLRLAGLAAGATALRVPLALTATTVQEGWHGDEVIDDDIEDPEAAWDVTEFARYQDVFAAGLEKAYRAKIEGA